MVRKHLIPESSNLVVSIPQEYIGKNVEVIIFAEEDMHDDKPVKRGLSKYKGALTKEQAANFQEFSKQIREEWERNI